MKIELSDGSTIYVKVTGIYHVGMAHYNDEYSVEVGIENMPFCSVVKTKDKKVAQEAVSKIGSYINDDESRNTYIEGFKEGTEYALKLMEKQDVN